jgi:ribosomal protein S18 acetylase RimI-like enzyme
MGSELSLRPAQPADETFLRRVYASTRADELAMVPWTPEEKAAFLDMQFTAQKTDYRARFPRSEHSIVLVDEVEVGRVWIDRGEDEIRLIDIALLPERRNGGTGTTLLRGLQAEASAADRPLRHSVYKQNTGALRFYQRLGFQVVEDFETYVLMEWIPDRVPESSAIREQQPGKAGS